MSDSLPRQFGRYTLTERLGAGGMGEVVVARDSLLQRQVAIKIPKSDMAHLDETPERLLREARASPRCILTISVRFSIVVGTGSSISLSCRCSGVLTSRSI